MCINVVNRNNISATELTSHQDGYNLNINVHKPYNVVSQMISHYIPAHPTLKDVSKFSRTVQHTVRKQPIQTPKC